MSEFMTCIETIYVLYFVVFNLYYWFINSFDFQSVSGVPAILIYKKGDLIGNFVGLSSELGDDFPPSDLEGFLIE